MELQLNKEPVFLNEVIYDGQTEQGVEFDYVLPDYYPDIFKILRCSLTPGILHTVFREHSCLLTVLFLSKYCTYQTITSTFTVWNTNTPTPKPWS